MTFRFDMDARERDRTRDDAPERSGGRAGRVVATSGATENPRHDAHALRAAWIWLALGLATLACGGEGSGPADAAMPTDASAVDGAVGDASAADASVALDAAMDAAFERDAGSPDAGPPPPDVRFMWPIDAWVAANDEYYMRGEHSGSADFAAPHGTPVFAARGGTVTSSRWTSLGGNTLVIAHGEGYSTLYSHLIEPAEVEVGDVVEAGQLVGALGRTGNAYLNGAHLHFAIRRDGVRLVIPGLDYGEWVQRGDPIPGDYAELDTFSALRPRYDVEVVDEGVPAFSGPAQSTSVIAELEAGEVLPVSGTAAGYYEVTLAGGRKGWVVHNATTPAGVRFSGVRITAANANIRSGPSTSDERIGTLPNGTLVTVFETQNSFHRLLFGLPTVYAWTHVSNTEPTAQHEARIRAPAANVRMGPSVSAEVIGSLRFTDRVIVRERRHGWYRIQHEGADAWVAGWLTQGRL